MAKNKNQNRQREHEQDRQRGSSGESQEHVKSAISDEHVMPAATQVSRKQQKKFGHN